MTPKSRVNRDSATSKAAKATALHRGQRARTVDELDAITLEVAARTLVETMVARGHKPPGTTREPLQWRAAMRAVFDLDDPRDDEARAVLAKVLADLERPSFRAARDLAYELKAQSRLGPNSRGLVAVGDALQVLAWIGVLPDNNHERRHMIHHLRHDLAWRWLDGSAKEYTLVGIVAGVARGTWGRMIESAKHAGAPWPTARDAINEERRQFGRLVRSLK